ncbi:MAG: diguanylate cyclase [Thermomicrobiales bacterium]
MASEDRWATLEASFRIARDPAIEGLLRVLRAHQPAGSGRTPAELRKRAQSAIVGLQESIVADVRLPGFVEEIGAVLCGVTDGSDDALFAILFHFEHVLHAPVPPSQAEELRRPIANVLMRLMLGWVDRRYRDAHAAEAKRLVTAQPHEVAGDSLLRDILDQAPFGMMVLDLNAGYPVAFSRGLEHLFGFTLEEELALPAEQLQNEDTADDDFDLLADMVAGRIPFLERISARPHKDGYSVPFRMLAWPVRDGEGNITHLAHQLTATALHTPETAGSGFAEKRARYLQQLSPDPVIIADADGIIRYASPSVESAFGHDPDWLVGKHVMVIVTPGSYPEGQRLLDGLRATPRARLVTELEAPMPDGSSRWFEVIATNLLDVDDVRGIVLQGRDITVRRELSARLEQMVHTEPLTGLLNRRGFLDRLHAWIEAHDAAGEADRPGTAVVCYIDLDEFKSVNDRYGHAAGDAVLMAIGDRLQALAEGRGFVGRIGGDEFVLLAEFADDEARIRFSMDLGEALSGTIAFDRDEIGFTGTAGTIDLTTHTMRSLDASTILRDADEGLIRAKASRRLV